jgi:SAM-dependent methyltransferase
VLDLGCGTGLLLSLAPPLPSRSYVGIDISSMMLDRARQNHPGYTFRWGDIREPIPLPRATVGLLACLYGPASYCADPLGVLEAQLPLLAPGGRFLFMLLAPAYRGRMSHIAPTELVTLLDRQQIVHRLGPLVAAGRIRYTLRPFSPAVTLPVSDRWPARAVLVPLLARLAGLGFRLSDRWGLTARRPYYWLVVGRRIA